MALFKGSRYEKVPGFAPDERGVLRFKGIGPRAMSPAEPVLEHSVALKERLDGLSNHYYRDPRAWHRLSEANSEALFPEDLLWEARDDDLSQDLGREKLGDVVLIPRREEQR